VPEVPIERIKALRDLTGAGVMDCKRALQETGGDQERAQELLRQRGADKVMKRASEATHEGIVDAYIHSGGRIGALVQVNCESDFVARTEEFRALAHELAMQVAAMNPLYLSREEMPQTNNLIPEEVCLLQQPFIKDPSRTVQDRITEVGAKTGENIRVRRFIRLALGQE
jgi:elongation factor Ts